MNPATLAALNDLCADEEFARRFRAGGSSARPLVKYLMDRGVSEGVAEYLSMAYCIGAVHAADEIGRTIDRLDKAMKP